MIEKRRIVSYYDNIQKSDEVKEEVKSVQCSFHVLFILGLTAHSQSRIKNFRYLKLRFI